MSTLQEWDAYLHEAEDEYTAAAEHLRMCGNYDFAIINTVPAAKERLRRAKARYQERLTAYIAFREARGRRSVDLPRTQPA